MSAATDTKNGPKCKFIDHSEHARGEISTLLDGKEVYRVEDRSADGKSGMYFTVSYPIYEIDPFFRPTISGFFRPDSASVTVEYTGHNRIKSEIATDLLISETSHGSYVNHIPGEPNVYYTIFNNQLVRQKGDDTQIILDYKAPSPPVKMEKERKIVVISPSDPVLGQYLDYFIGSVEGDYVAPYAYTTPGGITIINKPIYGRVILRSAPDSRFYLSYERDDNGTLVGEFVRTRLIPFREKIIAGEMEGCLSDGTPVYISYYDPGGSGRQITRQEYEAYLAQRRFAVAHVAGIPDVLAGLLGY